MINPNINMIDVTKCIDCRRGISLFVKKDGVISHLDVFESSYTKCNNQAEIEKYLVFSSKKQENFELYEPNEELRAFLNQQETWFMDILFLAHKVFNDNEEEDNNEKVNNFFNGCWVDGSIMIEQPNEHIENALLMLANQEGIEVNADDYPDLIKFQNQNSQKNG